MDVLDRLYRRVAAAFSREPGRPFTVADVYQTLVPYRQIRGEMGLSELAEYEHALLRLLAGEREYLELEQAEVQAEFRRELEATNPILGIYRDYADVAVQLNPFAPVVQASDPVVVTPMPSSAAPSPSPARRPAPDAADEPPPGPRPKPCPGCRAPLPVNRQVRFCPFCGKCLIPVPCPECSAMLAPEWAFCAGCGWPRPDGRPGPEHRLR
jgi:hypothetical protein